MKLNIGSSKKVDSIESFIITKLGKIVSNEKEVKDDSFEYKKGSYNIDRECRLLTEKNKPAYIHVEGISPPLNFSDISKNFNKKIKIDADSQKAILKKKLFIDLFAMSDTQDMKEIIFDILIIVNIILSFITCLYVTGVIQYMTRGG